MAKEAIGFIGLGQLGTPMVANILEDGYPMRAWNRTAEKAQPLVEKGARQADCPEDAVEPGGILMTCLSNDQALESLWAEHPGLFSRLGAEGIHVSMSTISPETGRRLARQHAERGGTYVASPVMGRPDAVAARGQLYLVSGPAAAVVRARPPLESIGRRVFEFGEDPGAAHVAKLASNFLIASAIEALAEAFTFSTKNGLDASRWHAMLSETIFACPIYKNYGQLILDGDYRRPLFQLALGLKDLGLVSQVAFESRTPMPLASLLRDRFLAAFAHGRGTWDWMSIAAEVEAQAGLEREAPTG
jgi:3-hydroxyisobutyrate dehydrogenase-like beta-hydroxyacid dehydrogenase